MHRQFLNYDELNGITQYTHYDADTDTMLFESVGDCSAALDYNKAVANDTDVTKKGIKEGWWAYGSIPVIAQLKLLTEHNIDVYKKEDQPRLWKLLEDPDWRYLKLTSKRHIVSAHD